MISKTALAWLTCCPASDGNFKITLKISNKETCEEALKVHGISKTARNSIEARLRIITREEKINGK